MDRGCFVVGGSAWLMLLVACGSFAAGCKEPGVKLYPVKGKVLFKDQPADGAQVVFLPAGDENAHYQGPRPTSIVKPDGTYEIVTEPHGKGAMLGEYAVLITWYPPDARDQFNPKNKLPNKYASQEKPLLKATVKEGENDLGTFNLTP